MINNERQPLKLTAENVSNVFRDCLFREEELKKGQPTCECAIGEGIRSNFVFNSERLNSHENDIIDMIDQLPDIEKGSSFFTLCMTTEGVQWGEHRNIE